MQMQQLHQSPHQPQQTQQGQSMQPKQPVQPVQPIEVMEPMHPMQVHPAHPAQPTQPLHPMQPTQPIQSIQTAHAGQPAQPAQPAQQMQQQAQQLELRRGNNLPPNYEPSQHGDIPTIPHNEYPTDGMTMFCRTGPPSERSSTVSANRPSSRDSHSNSEVSNPTSFSSNEPPSGKQSPVKPTNGVPMPGMANSKQEIQKKRSTFFSNSPFRRKSKHEKERQNSQQTPPAQTNRNTWAGTKTVKATTRTFQRQPIIGNECRTASPEPVDPRANFQLNVGNNVFDVASPEATAKRGSQAAGDKETELDPIAQALADLKVAGKQPAGRVSADRYHGMRTQTSSNASTVQSTRPAQPAQPAPAQSVKPPAPISDPNTARAKRGTPPPAYNDAQPVKRLDAPRPAFTSAQMQKTTQKYVGQTQNMFSSSTRSQRGAAPVQNAQPTKPISRAASPAPTRSVSPQPPIQTERRQSQYSINKPASTSYQSSSVNSRYRESPVTTPTKPVERSYSPQVSHRASPSPAPRASPSVSARASPNVVHRSVSPQPQFMRQERPASAGGMELQLSTNQMDMHGGGYNPGEYGGHSRSYSHMENTQRPMSMYYGSASDVGSGVQPYRSRSRSIAAPDGRPLSRDGRPILHFGQLFFLST